MWNAVEPREGRRPGAIRLQGWRSSPAPPTLSSHQRRRVDVRPGARHATDSSVQASGEAMQRRRMVESTRESFGSVRKPIRLETAEADPADVYGFFDIWWAECVGLDALDYTEGLYHGGDHRSRSLEDAQRDQRAWVLDQARVGPGSRLFEVGCGNGSLLEDAEARGARAVGITPNPNQVRLCRSRGLDVRQRTWQEVGSEHDDDFDAVVANGSLEHFVSLDEARWGLQERIYERFFDLCASLLDRTSRSGRVVLTFIAFRRIPDPDEVDKPSRELPFKSDAYHYRLLERTYRGWYPSGGEQVHRAAEPHFDLIEEEEGTHDYLMTTREWARRTRRLLLRRLPVVLPGLVRWLRDDPDAMERVRCFLHGSWGWQFEGDDPPCSLVRATYRLRT